MLAGLLALARALVELAETEVAVGDERAQAQFLGQGQSLAIVRVRAIDLDAVGMGRDVAEQSQDLALHPPFPPLPSRREPVLGDPGGVRQPSIVEVHPAERSDAAGPPHHPRGPLGEATGGVLHEGDRLGAAAGPVVRRTQRPGEVVEQQGHLSRPAEIEAAFQRGHGAREVALIEPKGSEAEEGLEKREDVPRLLRDVHRLAETPERLGVPPERPERPGQRVPHPRARDGVITESLLRQTLRDQRERGLAVPDALAALAPRHVLLAKNPVGDNLQGDVRVS